MSITRINEFQAAEGKSNELFDFLKSLVPFISGSNGCTSCEVLRNSDDLASFAVIEKWDSIENHKKSLENFPKEEMQAAMSLIGAPPKSSYYEA